MFTREWTICFCKKQIDVSFKCFCPVIDGEFQHNIVKVVCISTANSMKKLMINKRTDTWKTWHQFTNFLIVVLVLITSEKRVLASELYWLLLTSNSTRVLFTPRALARAIAPLSPILLFDKFKVLRVSFFSRALAIRQAPLSPIKLFDKSNWANVSFFSNTSANDSASLSSTFLPGQP